MEHDRRVEVLATRALFIFISHCDVVILPQKWEAEAKCWRSSFTCNRLRVCATLFTAIHLVWLDVWGVKCAI